MEEHCKQFIHQHSTALIEVINIEQTIFIAYEKGLLSMKRFKNLKSEILHVEKYESLEKIVSAIGSVRTVLLLCFILCDCKGPCSELRTTFTEKFNELASENLTTCNLGVLELSGLFTSDMTEFHNLCREIVENGDEQTFKKIVHKTIDDWKVVKCQENVHLAEKRRAADLCLHANCLLSLFYDTDDHIHNFEDEISQVVMYTSDQFESMLLVSASKLQFQSRSVKEDITFPENLRKYALEVDDKLLSKSYILCTEIMVLSSKLFKKPNSELLLSVREKLKKMKRIFKDEKKSKSEELYRQNFLYRRNCMEALCRLGLAFNLGNIPGIHIEQKDMDSVRNCIENITNVWSTMTLKWQMLAYGAMSKWSHLNGDNEEAEIFSRKMKVLAPTIPCICKMSTLKNVEKLLATCKQLTVARKYKYLSSRKLAYLWSDKRVNCK